MHKHYKNPVFEAGPKGSCKVFCQHRCFGLQGPDILKDQRRKDKRCVPDKESRRQNLRFCRFVHKLNTGIYC